jgi:hypothetical protein
MKMDGQLECAQLEQLADDAPALSALGRIYLNTKNALAVPYIRGIARWEQILTDNSPINARTDSYAVTIKDRIVTFDATAGSLAPTLPSAASATGKTLELSRLDAVIANDVTITAFAGDLIDGTTTFILKTKKDTIKIYSNGTGWILLSHTYDEGWVTMTPAAANWAANTTVTAKYKRKGKCIDGEWNFALTGAPDALQCICGMPTGFQVDTTAMANPTAGRQLFPAGVYIYDVSATSSYHGHATLVDVNTLGLMYAGQADIKLVNVDATHPVTFATGDSVNARISDIPIAKLR